MLSRDDIIEAASKAGFETLRDMIWVDQCEVTHTLTRFASLVAAAEREACARVRQDAERYKASASMWRNKAYELGGTPLPWDADEMLEKVIREEREACAKLCEDSIDLEPYPTLTEMAVAIRARGQQQEPEDENPSF
jgi:hypothetical protein